MMNKNRSKVILIVLLSALASIVNADLVLSNTNTNRPHEITFEGISGHYWYATPIKTDGFAYTLDSIVADIIIGGTTVGDLYMEIWTAGGSGGGPNAFLSSLNLVDEVSRAMEFTGSVSLSANTGYFVITKMKDFSHYGYSEMVNFTIGGDFGVDAGNWSLENAAGENLTYEAINGGAWNSDGNLSAPMRMDILATVIPEPAVLSLIAIFGGSLIVVNRWSKLSRSETKPTQFGLFEQPQRNKSFQPFVE